MAHEGSSEMVKKGSLTSLSSIIVDILSFPSVCGMGTRKSIGTIFV